jgi:hypothetical protein
MKRLVILACTSALAATALADPYTSARQQAKRAVNQTQARQAETQPAQPAPSTPPPQPAAPQPNPALAATQLNISNIAKDLEALQTDPLKKQPLINDLGAAAQGTSPSKASVSKLTDDLVTTLAGKNLAQDQRTKLAQYLRAIFNSSHVAPAQQRTILDDLQKMLQSAGVSLDDATKVVNDFKAIASETK